jgi:hypothetical protein
MNNLWLTPEILEWRVEAQGFSFADKHGWKRPYDIWAHAEQVLNHPTTEFLRVDAITTMKRAIDHRVRMLNNRYSLRTIPIKDKPSEILNLLEFAGIVRPLMLQKLLDIRNAVEHEDASPPDHHSCQIFLEFTWYFLRSTDRIAQQILDDFRLSPSDDEDYYWLSVDSGPEHHWIPKVRGWITPDMLSNTSKTEWIVLNVERTNTREELAARLRESGDPVKDGEVGRGKNPNDKYISAEVRGPSQVLTQLLEMYFAAV